jgi:hypothetical protein
LYAFPTCPMNINFSIPIRRKTKSTLS